MELIEIKEILRKASVEVDIQGHGKHTALFETDFERVAIEIVKKLTLTDVSQQRELLLAFEEYCCNLEYLTPNYEVLEENIKDFLANNCG